MSKNYETAPVPTDGMPKGIPYIIGNEAAERFSFYGMRTILVIFMTEYMLRYDGTEDFLSEDQAKTWFHMFVASAYFFPILGAILSDAFLGKYKTILILSIVYCLGHLTLALDETRIGLSIGLTLIAIGSGGIKPCVSAHVGDQFGTRNKHLLPRVFSWFYFSINFGSTISTLLTPVLLNRYGPHIAFGLPGLLMFLATWVFWLGRNKFVHVPPGGKDSVREALSGDGKKALLGLIPLYLFVAMFWSLFDQTGSAWVLQAKKMDRVWLGHEWLPSQIGAANPILVLILIPLFALVIYPAINRVFPLTPLRKIGIGLFVTAAAFAVPAWIASQIEGGTVISSKSRADEYSLSFFPDRSKWAAERLFDGKTDGTGWLSSSRQRYEKNKAGKKPEDIGPSQEFLPQEITIRLREDRPWNVSSIRIDAKTDLQDFLLQEQKKRLSRLPKEEHASSETLEPGDPKLAALAQNCQAKGIEVYVGKTRKGDPVLDDQGKQVTKDGKPQWAWGRKIGSITLEQRDGFQEIEMNPTEAEYLLFRIVDNWGGDFVSLGEIEVITDEALPEGADEYAAEVFPNVAAIGYKPNIVWQLLAYVLLTAAEVMVSITCLEFSYTQAPNKVKSFVMALYLLSVTLGNLFTAAVSWVIQNPDGSSKLEGASSYWFYTVVMLATAILFAILAPFYRGRTYIQDEID